jgi:hypothetical protein
VPILQACATCSGSSDLSAKPHEFSISFLPSFLPSVLGLELRAYTFFVLPFLVLSFFKIGSCKLFAWAGFEMKSS